MRTVLVINSGSSSMKLQLVDVDAGRAVAAAMVERIGQAAGTSRLTRGAESRSWDGEIADHAAALDRVRTLAADLGLDLHEGLIGIGHRVVHGGSVFGGPTLVDPDVVQQIRDLAVLAPLHNPANAAGIEQAGATFPGIPQVAVFDTSFFRSLPAAAYTYALDRDVASAHQIRRYGFHGTSHEYVSGQVTVLLGEGAARQIVLHLGNGASVSAISSGRPVDTSMGLTPLEGLVMGTRSGDVDPGVLLHLSRVAGLTVDDLDDLLNRRSGVFGLAGVSDFRDLHRMVDDGSAEAQLALDVYCHRVRKYLGAYHAILGGATAITFTAGVGENDAVVRAQIISGLEPLGISIDPDRNAARASSARVISPDGSPVTVLVVPTDEELAIARSTAALVTG